MFEKTACIALTLQAFSLGLDTPGDVVERHQYAVPCGFVTRQHPHADLHIEAPAIQRIVNRLIVKAQLALPKLSQFMDDWRRHIAPKHLVELRQQLRLAVSRKERQRALVHTQHAPLRHALAHPFRVRLKMRRNVFDALGAPALEQLLQPAVIL